MTTSATVSHGQAFTGTYSAQNTIKGWAFTVYKSTYSIVSVTKNTLCTTTKVRLSTHADGSDNLGEATFSGDVATFSSPIALSLNGKYYILVMNGTSFDHRYTANQNYPIAGQGSVSTWQFTGQSNDGVDYGDGQAVFNFESCLLSDSSSVAPTISTGTAGSVSYTTATISGNNVTNDGGSTVTERGIVYNTTGTPTTSDTKVIVSGTTGTFTANMSSLFSNTLYYIRAYATNAIGTSYGAQVTLTTLHAITFTANQVATSKSIDYNNGTITQAKLTSTVNSGSFDYFLNANGTTTQFNTGTITGATYTTGQVGNYALNTNDATQYMQSSIPTIVTPYTVAFWYNGTTTLGSQAEIIRLNGGGSYPKISVSANRILMYYGLEKYRYSTATVVAGNWYHIICEASGTNAADLHVYINGVLADGAAGNNTGSYSEPTTTFKIGGTAGRNDNFDEVLIYNRVLTPTEKTTLAAKGSVYSGLIAKYSFEEGSGNRTFDTSNWERVVSGTPYLFINSGTDLKWKACEKAGSPGTITQIKVEGYH